MLAEMLCYAILVLLTRRARNMKTLTCDLCDATADGETFDEWMQALMPHYMEAHADVMEQKKDDPEAAEAGKMQWMKENKARFDSTE